MQLIIKNPEAAGQIKEIEWNHEEIKAEVTEKVSHYKNLVYTDDQIGEAKKDKATLNKFITALEDKRKEIKKQFLAPYETFEKQIKEITGLVQESANAIDVQVKAYDDQKKAKKQEEIEGLYSGMGFQPFVTLDKIFNSKWLNSSTSMKQIEAELKDTMARIGNEIFTLQQLPEFGFEAMEVYKKELDINRAILKAKEMSEIAKAKKAAAEAEKARQEAQEQPQPQTETFEPPIMAMPKEEPERDWVAFKCLLSIEDAQALGQFFKNRNITFEQIEL